MKKPPATVFSRKQIGKYLRSLLPLFLAFGIALATCSEQQSTAPPAAPATQEAEPAAEMLAESDPQPTPTPDPTAEPTPGAGGLPESEELVVCLGAEPSSLYLYSTETLSGSQQAVLQALYDGPIDRRAYGYQPVILEKLPSLTDGDALMQAVDVNLGDVVVDADGRLVTLEAGISVQPSGCSSSDCALVYDGQTRLVMDEMVVTFQLLPGLAWSDGEPLTVQDSVFSFQIASQPATPGNKDLINRTAAYEALDETTVQWIGHPGFKDPTYFDNFWVPLPSHLLGGLGAADLLTAQESTRAPVGWGPYVLESWDEGESIAFRKNPNYFRAGEGLPAFERLTFRFVGDKTDGALALLLAGECDILDQIGGLDDRRELLSELESVGLAQAGFHPAPAWEHLDFGIQPASFDDGWVPGVDRPDFFADPQVRQAFGLCINRQAMVETLLPAGAEVPTSFVPPKHPALNTDLLPLEYDPEAGSALLESAGWFDSDNDGVREYAGVSERIPAGTPLALTVLAPDDSRLREAVLPMLVRNLAGCGIQVTPTRLHPDVFYRTGPSSQVYGRQFELALWSTPLSASCRDFLAGAVPGPGNLWTGYNISGYSGGDMELVCGQVSEFLPASIGQVDNDLLLAQQIFASDLPVIPFFQSLQTAATRPGLCGFRMDTTESNLWNLEALFYGECTEN